MYCVYVRVVPTLEQRLLRTHHTSKTRRDNGVFGHVVCSCALDFAQELVRFERTKLLGESYLLVIVHASVSIDGHTKAIFGSLHLQDWDKDQYQG
jgi:hypothetical protein